MNLLIRDLSKTYPNGTHALRGVSLTIPTGMFGLLGPNGAGKSTLMRILATLQEADAGTVTLGEIDVLRQEAEVRRVLGYLPQEFGLYPRASADELLDHFALLKGITDRRRRRATVDHLLHQTNLFAARKKQLGGFSGGMRQRFGIAVALLGDPRLIIVDEPTAGLDPAERVRFLNLLSELGENAVVILSTHIVEDVSELCSRMAIIDRGRILLEAEPLAATERLRGRVWRRVVERAELAGLEERFQVISTRLLAGRTVVRVVAAEAPDASFTPVEPELEDVYFATMRRIPLDAPRPVEHPGPDAGLPPSPASTPSAADATPPFADEPEPARPPSADEGRALAPSHDGPPAMPRSPSVPRPSTVAPSNPAPSTAAPPVPSTETMGVARTAGTANTPFLAPLTVDLPPPDPRDDLSADDHIGPDRGTSGGAEVRVTDGAA